jgi:hypothetical protein
MLTGSPLTLHQVDRRILASSIDLDIEFELIAFVKAAETRTLHRTDVDECVRLTVVARDETKALHRVEELYGAGCTFAGQLALRCGIALCHGNHVADDLKIAGRNLAAAIDEREFQFLTFGKAFQPGAFNGADVHEDIFAAFIALDEAEALVRVKEFYRAFALANDLRGHTAPATATTAGSTKAAAATGTAARAAAEAATITAAETAASAAAAEAITASATAAEPVATATETITAARERIESFFPEPVPLVASPSATTSIETHKPEYTFAPPNPTSPAAWANPAGRQSGPKR